MRAGGQPSPLAAPRSIGGARGCESELGEGGEWPEIRIFRYEQEQGKLRYIPQSPHRR